jgi:hypothetical protein
MEIQERINLLIKSLDKNVNSFSVDLQISSSIIHHIIVGSKSNGGKKNAPSYGLLVKICEKYPNVNLDWLMLGKGEMFKDSPTKKEDMAIVKPNDDVIKNLLSQLEEYKQRESFFIKQNIELSETVAHLVK